MDELDELFTAIREHCSTTTWSRGIELTRSGAITRLNQDKDGVELQVRTAGSRTRFTVTLHPANAEWECECESPNDACEHVAAAAISLRHEQRTGTNLPSTHTPVAAVRYRLDRDGNRIRLTRCLADPHETNIPVTIPLEEFINRKASLSCPEPEQIDFRIDKFLQVRQLDSMPGDLLVTLIPLLSKVTELYLGHERIAASSKPVLPQAVLSDSNHGFLLQVSRCADVTEVITSGVALCQGEPALLRPLGETALTGTRLERLPNQRTFNQGQIGDLVGEVLPQLKLRIPVEVKSAKLPVLRRDLRPHIMLEVSQQSECLSVLPTMVYGEPPTARIEQDKLIHIRGPLPIRDKSAEIRQEEHLRETYDMTVGRRMDATGPDALKLARSLDNYPGTIQGNAHRRLYPERALIPRVTIDGLGIEITFALDSDGSQPIQAEATDVLRAWENGNKLVPLLGGGWAALPDEWLNRLGPQISDLLLSQKDDGTFPPAARPSLAQLCDDLNEVRPPELQKLAPLLDGFEAIPATAPPCNLGTRLRDYQQRGVDWLSFLQTAGLGAILADDMGLGKTLQALCVMDGRCLVVCPTSVMHNWANEISHFRPTLTCEMYHGGGRKLNSACNVTITSYALLRIDADSLSKVHWKVLVLDETQAIKNPDSQTAKAAFRLSASFRIAISGTPVENHLEELWSQVHFTNPGILGSRAQFRQRYVDPIVSGDQAAAERLRNRVRPFILRRTKREVAPELPPRTETILYCVLNESERTLYDSVLLATRRDVVAQLATGRGIIGALEALLRLRQVACHRALLEESTSGSREPLMSSKVNRLLLALEQISASGHKALVFSQWTSFLNLLEPHLHGASISFERLDGSTRNRSAVVAKFQEDAGPPVMLLSLKAGGVGLNLTAADHVFLLDPWWNPATEAQAADRAHRIGQHKPVMVYRMVSRNTVEERIVELQQRKRELASTVLSDSGAETGITRDDLLALLQ